MRDTAAYIEMIKRHDHGLRMLVYRLLHDQREMDDVMQEAYLKAFRAYPRFRGDADVRTWLYRIVYNACLDRLREERRRPEVPTDWEPGETGASFPPQEDPAEIVCRSTDLAAALAALPPDHRAAVLLVDAAGFSYDEAAQVLGVRAGTIGSRLNAARSALRKSLNEEDRDAAH